eukprot:5831188-Prymnesium_polylepis.3
MFVPPLPAILLSLPSSVPAPSTQAAQWECVWAGAVDAPAIGPRQKLLHFVVMAPGVSDEDTIVLARRADAHLTSEGRERCRQLQRLTDSLRPDLFVTSPLTRSVQTTLLSFGPQIEAAGARVVALEEVRETLNYQCDARRPRADLVDAFPTVDFSGCTEIDPLWSKYERRHGGPDDFTNLRESNDAPALAARARRALTWLARQPEKEVVIVSHKVLCTSSYPSPWQPIPPPFLIKSASRAVSCRQDFLWNTINMGQPDGKFPNISPVYDFGDDGVRRWMCSAFTNCEVRSVLADFNPPPSKSGALGGRIASTKFGI